MEDNILIWNKKWLKEEKSLNYVPDECYNILNSAKSSIVKTISKIGQ